MGKHSGPAPERAGRGRRVRFAVAAVATFLAWLVLVYFAIRIGGQVRDGNADAWVLLVVATIGAVCCLFLALQLAGRVLERRNPVLEEHPAGGRRARR